MNAVQATKLLLTKTTVFRVELSFYPRKITRYTVLDSSQLMPTYNYIYKLSLEDLLTGVYVEHPSSLEHRGVLAHLPHHA